MAKGRREALERITNFRKSPLVWADILFLIQFILEIWLLCQGTRTIYSVFLQWTSIPLIHLFANAVDWKVLLLGKRPT